MVLPASTRRHFLAGAAAAATPAAALAGAEPGARFAYVGCFTQDHDAKGKGVGVYRIEADGRWSAVETVAGLADPYAVTVNRPKAVLYCGHSKGDKVSAFAIDRASGRLKPLGAQAANGISTTNLAIDPSGDFLLSANYESGNLSLFPIQPDGSLGPLAGQKAFGGPFGPRTQEQSSAEPHEVVFDPRGRFFVTPQKGADRLTTLRLDRERREIVEVASIRTRSGAGPRHMAFHRRRPVAYVVNELDCSVAVYAYDVDSGRLSPVQIRSTLPDDFVGDNTCSTIEVHPDGRFLYAVNRGHNSVVRFPMGAEGALGAPAWTLSEQGRISAAAITPDGGSVCVTGAVGLSVYRVDRASGGLSRLQGPLSAPNAVGVAFF